MKLHYLIMGALLVAILTACEQKPTTATDKVVDKVNDALERRPNEKVLDAAEDVSNAVKDASQEIQKGVEAVTEEMKKYCHRGSAKTRCDNHPPVLHM